MLTRLSSRGSSEGGFRDDFRGQIGVPNGITWFGALAQKNDRLLIGASHRSAALLPGGVILYLAETDNVTNDVSLVIPEQHLSALSQPVVQCAIRCILLVP